MKKGIIIIGLTIFACMIAGVTMGCALPASNIFNSVNSSIYEIDTSKDINLDFKNAKISVSGWDSNYVKVSYDSVMKGKKKLEIKNEDNTLTLVSDVTTGISIKIPKTTTNMKAAEIRAKYCTLKTLNADKITLKYCTTAEDFVSEGGSIEIRESEMAANAVIKNSVVELRECNIEDVTLTSENADKKIDAQLRDLKGLSVKIDTKSCNSLSAEIRDPKLQKLVIDSDSDKGTISVISGSIDIIENNSKISIKNKKRPIG